MTELPQPPSKPVIWHIEAYDSADHAYAYAKSAYEAFMVTNLCAEDGLPASFSDVKCTIIDADSKLDITHPRRLDNVDTTK